jgi:hypothetical protein
MIFIVGADYLIHPGVWRFQQQVKLQLRSLPLPVGAKEVDFSSGYQPTKGRAERTFISDGDPRHVCDFYRSLMFERGWERTEENCYSPAGLETLIEFKKSKLTCKIARDYKNPRREDIYRIRFEWER